MHGGERLSALQHCTADPDHTVPRPMAESVPRTLVPSARSPPCSLPVWPTGFQSRHSLFAFFRQQEDGVPSTVVHLPGLGGRTYVGCIRVEPVTGAKTSRPSPGLSAALTWRNTYAESTMLVPGRA
jgi:hypothetical protein